MDLRKLKTLIDLVQQSDIAELEITEGEEKVRISRFGGASAPVMMAHSAPQQMVHLPAADPVDAAPAAEAPPAEPEGHVVKSPMVGTFYRSASPEAEPFARSGTRIALDQTLCIIEAMKVMNEIKAETRGVITAVVAENGKPVEFGQVLFKIRPL